MRNFLMNENDMVDNPTPRVPVCLCLDTSGSMSGMPIDELNEGVRLFYEAIQSDEASMYSAEISIVTFGGNAECQVEFSTLESRIAPCFCAEGGTPMGEAVNMALDMLEARKAKYREHGIDYYQPWLVLMTDGEPNGSDSDMQRAIHRTRKMIYDRKLTIFPIGIGPNADMKVLENFSPNRAPVKLQGLKFREFFEWLSQSVSTTSVSILGESVSLGSIAGWAQLNI